MDADIERDLTQLEHAGWAALAAGGGARFYEDVFLDFGLMIFPMGTFGKSEALEGLAARRRGRVTTSTT
jgi:hypothetical protein